MNVGGYNIDGIIISCLYFDITSQSLHQHSVARLVVVVVVVVVDRVEEEALLLLEREEVHRLIPSY